MKVGIRAIDHIVYCVHDLDHAISEFETKLGVAPVFGGYHTTQGTKNALLNLGNQCYLELLAADPENKVVTKERWMGVDLLNNPQITRWSLKSTDLNADSTILRQYNPLMGRIEDGQRKTTTGALLRWGIIMPLPAPEMDVIPFMTDWSASPVHPTDSLEPKCRLVDISLSHPDPPSVKDTLEQLSVEINVSQSNYPSIKIQIDSPNGLIEL